jgi:hypothetical protein
VGSEDGFRDELPPENGISPSKSLSRAIVRRQNGAIKLRQIAVAPLSLIAAVQSQI